MKIICQIFRSNKEDGMYLYVKKEEGLSRVPEELLKLFGTPQPAMVILLTPDKKLAQTSVEKVAQCLDEQGFFLQLPPRDQLDDEQRRLRSLNAKLSGS